MTLRTTTGSPPVPGSTRYPVRALLTPLLLLASVATWSSQVQALLPAATVTLTWEAPVLAPDQAPLDGYVVARRVAPSGVYAELTRLPATALTYADPLAEPGTYTYVVRAVRGEVTSDASNETSVLLPMPPPQALHARLTLDPPPVPDPPVAPAGPYPLRPVGSVTVQAVDSQEIPGYAQELAVDGIPATFWHSQWRTAQPPLPHTLTLDLGASLWVDGLTYLGRQDGNLNGLITRARLETSPDLVTWVEAATVTWEADRTAKPVRFAPVLARYVRLVALVSAGSRPDAWAGAAEVGVYATGSGSSAGVEATP